MKGAPAWSLRSVLFAIALAGHRVERPPPESMNR